MMQSVLDGIEDQRKREEEKRLGKPSEDPLLGARKAAEDTRKRAQDKLASKIFDLHQPDANETKIQLGFRLAQKLGFDVDALESNGTLGAALDYALSRMGTQEKNRIAKDLGLDKLNLTLDDLLVGIRKPNPFREKTEGEAAAEKKPDPFLEEAKVKQRLDDASRERSLTEKKLALQDPNCGRVVDQDILAEDLRDVRASEALEKLKDAHRLQERTQDDRSGFPSELIAAPPASPSVQASDPDLSTEKPDSQGSKPGDDPLDRSTGPKGAKAVQIRAGHALPGADGFLFMPRLDEIGLYSNLTSLL